MMDWPHAPPHRLTEHGAYMVTAGIYQKAQVLNTAERLDMVCRLLFASLKESGWELHAWAVLSNHYHFIASAPSDPGTLHRAISKLHAVSAKELNLLDRRPGRKVWFQYFDSYISFLNSYLPRLKYVHTNPVHHGLVARAENYAWCSAAWFARTTSPTFQKTVNSFKTDTVIVYDSFDVRRLPDIDMESGGMPPQSKGPADEPPGERNG